MKRVKHKVEKRKLLEVLSTGKPDMPYNPEFVAMVREAERQIQEGKCVKLKPGSSIWELLHSIE